MRTLSPQQIAKLVEGQYREPGQKLGLHRFRGRGFDGLVVRYFNPRAKSVSLLGDGRRPMSMSQVHPAGLFEGQLNGESQKFPYRLKVWTRGGGSQPTTIHDPYGFASGPLITAEDERLFLDGKHYRIYEKLGAHVLTIDGVKGMHFAVWAPEARYVAVIGEWNDWDARVHPMSRRESSGIWELFVPGVGLNVLYKYAITTTEGKTFAKRDPYGFAAQLRPKKSSVTWDLATFRWKDDFWMAERREFDPHSCPISVYEAHLASWIRKDDEKNPHHNYRELARRLVAYVKKMGFTHIELMPITEYPLDASWGYQVTGYFSPTRRFGTPRDFQYFVDYCHRNGIGVIIDWVPAHFPTDAHGLGRFDGTHLYEHADPRQGFHPDWKTYIYNYGRNEVRNFLVANALFWLEKYHIDGLRVDAVASMLYLDYSRRPGQWVPNRYGGKENLEAIYFMKSLNALIRSRHPGVMTIAEESTSWPGVTGSPSEKGLGFTFKWNMGWMHDSLAYLSKKPASRRYHHDKLTFMLHYAFSEKYALPLSHDEVVHGKKSLIRKMPGTAEEKFANLRLLYGFMMGHPGKKVLFMGSEFAQMREWSEKREISWYLLSKPEHERVRKYVRSLNFFYRAHRALYEEEYSYRKFEWIDYADSRQSVVSFYRRGRDERDFLIFVFNFGPTDFSGYRIGVPAAGDYREVFSSNRKVFGGTGAGNPGVVRSSPGEPIHGHDNSVTLRLPPLTMVVLKAVS